MDNKTMARLLAETADLMEIDGADSFRIRSYRRAAEAAEQTTVDLVEAATDTKRLLEIDGIGKSMAAKLQEIASTGELPQREELLAKYGAGVLDLLKLPGMGPKTIALLWDAAKIGSVDQTAEELSKRAVWPGPCRAWGQNRLRSCAKASTITGGRRGVSASMLRRKKRSGSRPLSASNLQKGIDKSNACSGSLRRGRETIGDLDLLVTGPACALEKTAGAVEYVAAYPGIHNIIAKGENKVSFNTEQEHAGGRATAAILLVWRRAAVLYGIEGAQRDAAPALLEDGLTTLSEWALARAVMTARSTVATATRGRDLCSAQDGLDASRDAREPG